MVTPRTLGREVFENAVRYRVAACRKRLRISRTTPRAQIHINLDERSRRLDLHSTNGDTAVSERAGEQEEAGSA